MKINKVEEYINPQAELLKVLKYLPNLGEEGPWVAGGSVWKAMENRPIDNYDIDFFFSTKDQFKEFYGMFKSLPYWKRVISQTKNDFNTSIRYHVNDDTGLNRTVTIQLIHFRFWKDIESLIGDFDFTACQFAYDGKQLYFGDNSLEHLKNKQIVINKVRTAKLTETHIQRYLDYGFTISKEQSEILSKAIEEANLKKEVRDKAIKEGKTVDNDDNWLNYENIPPTNGYLANFFVEPTYVTAPYIPQYRDIQINTTNIGNATIGIEPTREYNTEGILTTNNVATYNPILVQADPPTLNTGFHRATFMVNMDIEGTPNQAEDPYPTIPIDDVYRTN